MAERRIVDTNVPLVAAARQDRATAKCRRTCEIFVKLILNGEICVVIDDNQAAYSEYRNNMYPDPNPSSGLASNFLMHIIQNYGNDERVLRIPLIRNENGEYLMWPQDKKLADFDPADRKWVALARAFRQETGQSAPIVYAIERGWDKFRVALTRHGVELDHLCAADHHAGRAALRFSL